MKQVLWVSRHEMTPDQRANLNRALGGPVELLPLMEGRPVLAGNLLTLAKGLGLTMEGRLEVDSRLALGLWASRAGRCWALPGRFQ